MGTKRAIAFSICLFLIVFLLKIESSGAKICEHPEMATVKISRKGNVVSEVSVTLATTPIRQQRGLMYCPALSKGTGMLFIYPDATRRAFWMKDTLIELAIIFIFADGRIAAIEHGEPGNLNHIQSPDDIHLVLEINYSEGRNLMVGDIVSLRLNSN